MKKTKWLIVRKKEMTRLRSDNKQVVVTLLEVVPQEVVGYKTIEKDGYSAAVLWVGKKETGAEKGKKVAYTLLKEFWSDETFESSHPAGSVVSTEILDGSTEVSLTGVSKGKGYQGPVRRFHVQWWNKTHGSKFHRHVGSLGNRKPRRVQKWHPHAGHMWLETITLHKRPVVETLTLQGKPFVAIKGSVPGAYNGYLSLYVG